MRRPDELRSVFASTTGGVMTVEAGAITGELELMTRPTPEGAGIEVLVGYAGAAELYTVVGSPQPGILGHPDSGGHRRLHNRILETLTTPAAVERGNELPVSLGDSLGDK